MADCTCIAVLESLRDRALAGMLAAEQVQSTNRAVRYREYVTALNAAIGELQGKPSALFANPSSVTFGGLTRRSGDPQQVLDWHPQPANRPAPTRDLEPTPHGGGDSEVPF